VDSFIFISLKLKNLGDGVKGFELMKKYLT